MLLFNFSNIVFEWYTGLPSKSTFLKDRAVPAKSNDKFINNQCVQCWERYTASHPAVKILPCLHFFGRDCLHDIVNGPTGDLCPYCRVTLFRRPPTIEDILRPLDMMLESSIVLYIRMVERQNTQFRRSMINIATQHRWLRLSVDMLFFGLAPRAANSVCQHMGICARNPRVKIHKIFQSTAVLSHPLPVGVTYTTPALLPMYLMFGATAFKVSFVVVDLAITFFSHAVTMGYIEIPVGLPELNGAKFDVDADRYLVTCIAAVAIVFQQLCIIILLWPVFLQVRMDGLSD